MAAQDSRIVEISVVTPVFNAERFVRRAVESAVRLSEVSEIILIDDAGPDRSLDICRQLELEFSKVRLLRHPDRANHGAGASRNLGIAHARCEFIAFLDADDYYLPNRFLKERDILLTDSTADGVYGAIGVDYESDSARQKFHEAGYSYQEFLTLSGHVPPEELIEVLCDCHPRVVGQFSTIAITVRKSLFARSGVFNEKLRLRQDIHLWRRMAAVGRLMPGSIEDPIAIRGVHGANRMINHAEHAACLDYWWDNLHEWFSSTPRVSRRAKAAFDRAYCNYRIKYRAPWERRRAFLGYMFRNPALMFQPMGFFDLNLFEAFGRNWFTLHLASAKNRFLAMWQN